MKKLLIMFSAPPIIAVPIYVITNSMSTGSSGNIPIGIWVLNIIFLGAFTLIYIWSALSGLFHWLVPVQLITQGAIISVFAIQFGISIFLWIGVLLTLIGLILSGFMIISRNSTNTATQSKLNSYDIFESYPFPACVSDKSGSLISISNSLVQLIGKNKDDLLQTKVSSFIPQNGILQCGEKLLYVNKHESKSKTWYVFNDKINNLNENRNGLQIQDAETEIFSKEYCRIRTEEEVVRIKRYKRWGVFMLIKINFYNEDDEEVSINKQSELEFFRSFCSFVKNSLRNSDTVSRVDEFSVLIILTETLSEDPVNGVINKILKYPDQLSYVISQLNCKVTPSISHIFYNASSIDMSFDDIINVLNKTLSDYDSVS